MILVMGRMKDQLGEQRYQKHVLHKLSARVVFATGAVFPVSPIIGYALKH
jgi:hypothetical protein